jgi:glycosyltransferase involved in cell wall biosynthesis
VTLSSQSSPPNDGRQDGTAACGGGDHVEHRAQREIPAAHAAARRIAFCITDLDVGGAEQSLVNLAGGLDRRDWSPHVYCVSRRGPLVDRLEAHQVPCTCLNWRGPRDAWRLLQLARKLRAWRPGLLQTFLFHGNMAGRMAGHLAGVPVIVSGIRVAEREQRWHVRLERLTRGLVTHHVCVSRSVAEFSIREAGLRPESVSVIPNSVDTRRFASAPPLSPQELGAPPGTRWIIAVGRLHSQKGHRLLIDALAPLLNMSPAWRLMIVGEGPLRAELQRHVDALECREQIRLLGFRDDVARLLKSAELFVLPSLWEGQPNVVLEAMAAGLPVIASDVEGVRELIEPGVSGVIVEPGNEAALRAAIRALLDSPAQRAAMGAESQHLVGKSLTTESLVERYAALYRRLLENRAC